MPAYILKVLAPAAQSFIRHSHATLPSAACSPISHFSPKIRKFGVGSQKVPRSKNGKLNEGILLTDPHSAFFQKVNFSIEKSADQIYFFPN